MSGKSRSPIRRNERPDWAEKHGTRFGIEERTPLTELMRSEGDEVASSAMLIRREALATWADWIFERGPHPKDTIKRLYAFARAYRPAKLAKLSRAQLEVIFGETRAAASGRIELMIEDKIKAGAYVSKTSTVKDTIKQPERRRKRRAGTTSLRWRGEQSHPTECFDNGASVTAAAQP